MNDEQPIWTVRPVLKDLYLNPLNLISYVLLTCLGGLGIVMLVAKVASRKATRFTLTSERIVLESGVFTKVVDDVELYRVQDTKVSQGIVDRLIGIGQVHVNTDDLTGNFVLRSVEDPVRLREGIRKATEDLKRARSVRVITS